MGLSRPGDEQAAGADEQQQHHPHYLCHCNCDTVTATAQSSVDSQCQQELTQQCVANKVTAHYLIPAAAAAAAAAAAQFMEWSQCVCSKLQEQGYWCDYIDPCSGLPVSCGFVLSIVV
jgi:hypothetical protein